MARLNYNFFFLSSSILLIFFSSFSHSLTLDDSRKIKEEHCPQLKGSSKYEAWATRYHNATGACYMTGQRGPCNRNMIYYAIKDDQIYGECDCNYDVECRSLIYSSVFDECFFAFEQAHCNEGYWLVADQNGKPVCSKNYCRSTQKYTPDSHWALYKGRCEKLYEPIHDCRAGDYLWIPKGHRYPICGRADCKNPHNFVPELECQIGSKLFHESKCTRFKHI